MGTIIFFVCEFTMDKFNQHIIRKRRVQLLEETVVCKKETAHDIMPYSNTNCLIDQYKVNNNDSVLVLDDPNQAPDAEILTQPLGDCVESEAAKSRWGSKPSSSNTTHELSTVEIVVSVAIFFIIMVLVLGIKKGWWCRLYKATRRTWTFPNG